MPVLVGVPRSGTTLLRLMLDAHSQLAIPPETGFLALADAWTETPPSPAEFVRAVTGFPEGAPVWPDFALSADDFARAVGALDPFTVADGFRAFYRLYAARWNKPRWGDKTPGYAGRIDAIARLVPEARIVHVIRDGRDVALSLGRQWFSPGPDLDTQARYWRDIVTHTRRLGRDVPHYLEVRYEALIAGEAEVLREICDFIELPYEPAMQHDPDRAAGRLREHGARHDESGRLVLSRDARARQQATTAGPIDPSKVGAWRTYFTAEDAKTFELAAGDVLRDLGYDD